MKISRVGYTRCPGCLCHVKVAADTSECPFCGDELAEAETLGVAAMEKLRSSRTALIAMGLAGGVSFAVACGDPEPKPDPNNTTNTSNTNGTSNDIDPQSDYGNFDPNIDPGIDQGTVEEDMGFVDPGNDYGGFDPGNIDPGPDMGGGGADQG